MGETCIWESLWFAQKRSVGENIFGEFDKSICVYVCRDVLDKSFLVVPFLFTLVQKSCGWVYHALSCIYTVCDAVELFFLLWSNQDWVVAQMWCQSRKKSLSGTSQLSLESFQSFEDCWMTLDGSCFEREWNIQKNILGFNLVRLSHALGLVSCLWKTPICVAVPCLN